MHLKNEKKRLSSLFAKQSMIYVGNLIIPRTLIHLNIHLNIYIYQSASDHLHNMDSHCFFIFFVLLLQEHFILYMHIGTIQGKAYQNKTTIPPLKTGPVRAVQRKDKRWEDKMEIWRGHKGESCH